MGHRCAKPGPKHHEQPYHGKMSLQRSTRHTAYKPLRRPKTAHSACFRAILAHDAPAAHPGPPQQLFAKTAAVYTNRQTAYPFCILGNNTRRASRRTFLVRWTPVDSLPAPNSEPLPQLPAPAAPVSCSRNHAKGDHLLHAAKTLVSLHPVHLCKHSVRHGNFQINSKSYNHAQT
jgi:hypothetical protein